LKKKALFIVNPRSGKGRIKGNLLDIVDVFVKGDFEVTIYTTQKQRDAVELTKNRSRDYDLVICSGGDGTLDEVVTGMKRSGFRTPIGYIPCGSTNDFAKSLGLPSVFKSAAEIIVNGSPFSCDVGLFNDDVFVYIAAFGIFTEVSYETPQEMKNILGHMAYLLEGMKQLQRIKSYRMKIMFKGTNKEHGDEIIEREIEDDFIFGMITNTLSVGGFKSITENVK